MQIMEIIKLNKHLLKEYFANKKINTPKILKILFKIKKKFRFTNFWVFFKFEEGKIQSQN